MRDAGQEPSRADTAMERYATGDDDAFAELYDDLSPRLFGFLFRQAGERAAEEDLLQQTFLHLHRARGSFVAGAPVLPWAFAIARRLAIDSGRRARHRATSTMDPALLDTLVASETRSALDALDTSELAQRLSHALAHLPLGQRAAFELVKEEGLSCREASRVLGTSEAAIKLRSHRACVALREALATDHPSQEGMT